PTISRVRTVLLRPGLVRAVVACASSEHLISAWHAVGFYTQSAPSPALIQGVSATHRVQGRRVQASVRSTAAVQGIRPVVRIGAATAAVRTFLDRVPGRLQVGLIAFAGDPAVATPPTTNHDLVRKSLDTIEWFPSFGGTAIGDALAAAVKLGQQAVTGDNGNLASASTAAPNTPTHGLVSILFLSDGAQTRGELEPLEGADLAKAAGIPVYTVALGTPNGVLNFGAGGGGGGGGGGFPGQFGGRRVPVP